MLAATLVDEAPANAAETNYNFSVKVTNVDTPKPAGDQVQVKLQACSYNHRDNWIRQGLYPGVKSGSVLGSDGVGVVSEGDDALTGKQVMIVPGQGWDSDPRGPEGRYGMLGLLPLPGTWGEYIVVDKKDVVQCPPHLSTAEASALPLAGLTAYRATFTKGQVRKGDNVLVTGIGGGVALFALQFAVAAGANVYVTSSKEDKIERAIQLGAKGDNWHKDLQTLLGKGQINTVIDGAGGKAYNVYPRVMAIGGIVVNYGQTSAKDPVTFPMTYVLKNIDLRGSTMGSRQEFYDMVEFVDKHKIKPIVSQVWQGLTESNIEAAFTVMRNGEQFGKLVIELADTTHNKL
ncbi:hypothetical protein INT43_004304 [Umbelopsis isabellina]|uniref:Enoyl reductase (ER) domain-containing protein n=1 Tax=Mortierella isabellina TaxID=91625 RepID=A0A8H7PI04_MORIS|nr:hypothetical protein INT43_004304 [Umbelopsis isabellina]